MRTALLVFAALVGGFGVAEWTQSRLVGGAVMVVLASVAAVLTFRKSGMWRTILVGAVFVGVFSASHPAAATVGSWPAALGAGVVAGLVAWWAQQGSIHG